MLSTSSNCNITSRRRITICAMVMILALLSACASEAPAKPQPPQTPAASPTPSPQPTTETFVETTPDPVPTTEPLSATTTLVTETVTLAPPPPLQNAEIVDRPLRNVRALTDGSRKYKLALWSPGAGWIAATPQDGPGLDAINADSGEVRSIVTDTFVLEPIWLDATTLLVHRVADDGDQLIQVALTEQSTRSTSLVTNAPPLRAIGAGGSVTFATQEQLSILHQPTRQDIQLPLQALVAAPAPQDQDGITIAINPAVANLESITTLLLRIANDRATITPLSNANEGLWLPRWSADGSRLALTSIGGRIVSSSRDGSERFDLGPGDLPAWSPDGTRLAYAGTSAGLEFLARDIHLVDWQGQGPRLRLTDANEEQFFTSPSWSPDGARLAFVEIDDGKIYVGAPPR